MPRDSRVEPLQFRHPKTGFRYRPGRNFSEKLEVVRVHLLEHGNRAGCPHEVDASGCRVILEVVGAAHAVQPLNHFSRLRIDDCQSARFMLVPAPYVARVCRHPAANKQAMMVQIQPGGRGNGASGVGQLATTARFSRSTTATWLSPPTISPIVTYNLFPDGSIVIPAGSPPGSLMLPTNWAVLVSTTSIEALLAPCWPLPPKSSKTSTPA